MRVRNELLHKLRVQGGWSQEEVATGCRIDIKTYGNWERGIVNRGLAALKEFKFWRQQDILERIAAFFSVEPEELIERGPHEVRDEHEVPDGPYNPATYVHREEEEKRALNRLRGPGSPVVLLGPLLFGKATMLGYLLAKALEHAGQSAARVVRVNLSKLESKCFASLDSFLRTLGHLILSAADPRDVDQRIAHAWRGPDSEKSKLTWLLEEQVLPQGGPLILALEKADMLESSPFKFDVFSLLRGWAERKTREPWSWLRILVTIATEPSVLEDADRYSPFFNLAIPIRLDSMRPAELRKMSEQYGHRADDPVLAKLGDLLGGHPYLFHLALYEAASAEIPLAAMLTDGAPFRNHLTYLRGRVEQDVELAQEFHWWLKDPSRGLRFESYCRLYSKGLVVQDRGAYRLRCKLYEDFFRCP